MKKSAKEKEEEIGKAPHPLDIALGARVKMMRRQAGMSQDDLAQATGITFQQIQKYEHGVNRISFSRLCEIAAAFGVVVQDIIAGLETGSRGRGSVNKIADVMLKLNEPVIQELVDAAILITDKKQRRNLLGIAKQLGKAA
jgi:transcriptional regulator with XRE-family HTH domain